jgi:hypothetical protein
MRVATTEYEEENTSRKSARRDGQTTASSGGGGAPPAVTAIVNDLMTKVTGLANGPAGTVIKPSSVDASKSAARSKSPIINTDLENGGPVFSGPRSEKELRLMLLAIEYFDPSPHVQMQNRSKLILDHLKRLAYSFSAVDPKPVLARDLAKTVNKWTVQVLESADLDFADMLGIEFVLRLKRLSSMLESIIQCKDRHDLKELHKRYYAYKNSNQVVGGHFSVAVSNALGFFEKMCYEYIGRNAIALL